uniref:Uncharacterized protein n=1 Tax=Arundo donax TaxID=35708 RepID=A0A0A8ZST2_ARUDO
MYSEVSNKLEPNTRCLGSSFKMPIRD